MKLRTFLVGLCSMVLTLPVFSQDLLLTGIFDGPLIGGTPKALEFYAVNDIADLSLYGLGVANNGGGSDGLEYSFPADALTAGDFIYLTNNDTEFDTYFGFSETYLNGISNVNGDDAIEVYFNGGVYDVFGDVIPDGTGTDWEYLDTWFYRLDGTSSNTVWQIGDWNSPGINSNDDELDNASASNPFPVGTYDPNGTSTPGCTDSNACNFDAAATVDDGSCELPGDSCDDGNSATVNDEIQVDCSCAGVTNDCVRFTSVDPSTGDITIENFGSVDADISMYRLCALFQYTTSLMGLDAIDLDLSPGESVTVNWPMNGTASDLGLYLPTGSFGSAASMVDFTQWGSGGLGRENVAVSAGLWSAGDFVDMTTPWNSPYTYTGSLCTDNGVSNWTGADCAGVQGGSSFAGASCDDGDAATADDVYDSSCNCAGVPFTISNDLIITAVFDGPLSGGVPKGVELYAINDIQDLSNFGLASITNGQGSPGQEYTFPADALTAGDYIFVSNDETGAQTYFETATANYQTNVTSINGDDAIELYEFGTVIDTFGDINTDGSGTDWDYLDSWAHRNCEQSPNAGAFNAVNWTFGGINNNDGSTLNSQTANPMPVGAYEALCPSIVPGCTNSSACNYNMNATEDDGSCELPGDSCDDGDSLTENDVLQSDCSCAGTTIVTCDPMVWSPAEVLTNSGFNAGGAFVDQGSGTYSVNGYCGNGCAEPVDTWLVSNGYDFSAVVTSTFLFDLAEQFSSSVLDFQYTTAFAGDPSASTWTSLGTYDSPGALSVDLSSLAGMSSVYLAFQYADDGTDNYSNFTLSNMVLTEDCPEDATVYDCPAETANFGDSCDDLDAGTIDDIIQPDCSCAGTPFTLSNDLIITAVFDGPLSGGTPKAVELYVVNDIADLSNFGIGSANNGGGTDGEEWTFPADAATAGQFIYLTSNFTEFTSFFGFDADYDAGGAVNVNGDDAVELFESGQVIDTFGDINMDGSGTAWDFLDGWAYRNCETGPDGAVFVEANWTFSGINVLDNETANATAATPLPIGTYMTVCGGMEGCTDENASNYDEDAVTDDGSCEFLGCTDPDFLEYNPYAQVDDGSCSELIVYGCIYEDADNFSPTANVDDLSCVFSGTNCPGDFNQDGIVTAADLTQFLSVFGLECD